MVGEIHIRISKIDVSETYSLFLPEMLFTFLLLVLWLLLVVFYHHHFIIIILGDYHPTLDTNLKQFIQSVQQEISFLTRASPLRYQNPQITYTAGYTYYLGTMVEQAPTICKCISLSLSLFITLCKFHSSFWIVFSLSSVILILIGT